MKKFILTGTDNDGFRHRYSLKKLDEFKEVFINFMIELGFDEEKTKNSFKSGYYDEEDQYIEFELKVKDIEDICWNFQNKKYDVDVFFGRFKIILVIRAKERVSMVNHLEKKANWIKPLGIKKIKEAKNKIFVPLRKARSITK